MMRFIEDQFSQMHTTGVIFSQAKRSKVKKKCTVHQINARQISDTNLLKYQLTKKSSCKLFMHFVLQQ